MVPGILPNWHSTKLGFCPKPTSKVSKCRCEAVQSLSIAMLYSYLQFGYAMCQDVQWGLRHSLSVCVLHWYQCKLQEAGRWSNLITEYSGPLDRHVHVQSKIPNFVLPLYLICLSMSGSSESIVPCTMSGTYWIRAYPQEYHCSGQKNAWIRRQPRSGCCLKAAADVSSILDNKISYCPGLLHLKLSWY